MTTQSAFRSPLSNQWKSAWMLILVAFSAAFFSTAVFAQQTGEIAGQVTDASDGSAIAGVSIQADGPNLPGSRSTTTSANGDYRLPSLPPGSYTVVYSLPDGTTRIRATEVLLQQRATVDLVVDYGLEEAMMEEVIVVATTPLTETSGASINTSINNDLFDALPVGNEYRDLVKLIPGVQLTQDSVRGPSAGGSGQDNSYQFDGVDVSLPMFGTLSAEPSTHDIDQVAIVRGGAKAIGFNRSGGFTINTISKSGTDEFHGEASYQAQPSSFESDRKHDSSEEFEEDKEWITANFSGPLIKDQLYFYASYFRPTVEHVNRSNVYGEVPDYKSVRDEYFVKLTWAPTENLLFDGSYRTSDRTVSNDGVGAFDHASTSDGAEAAQDIGILEGSWIISSNSNAYFKVTDFSNETLGRPDNQLNLPISIGDSLDINNLDQMGLFSVPRPDEGEDDYNAFIQPLINKYGYIDNGVPTGGGAGGAATTFNNQDFFRKSFEIGYDVTVDGKNTSHDLHIGYKWERNEEDLERISNGWGSVTVPGGLDETDDGVPIFYRARFYQGTLGGLGAIKSTHSESKLQSIEINDTIYWNDLTFNVGVMISNDELYGQGLKTNSSNVSGFESAPGHKYLMNESKWGDMVAPRLGVTWDFRDNATLFANYAKYFPSASTLARAASWDRSLTTRLINAYFDADGNFIEVDPERSSSGKLFQEGIDPRFVTEYIVGTNWEFTDRFTGRAHVRYREGGNFWEDTPNGSRLLYEPPPGIPQELYIPNLEEMGPDVGANFSERSYVIALLDSAHTDYWEVNLEGEYQGDRFFLRASYVWSDYTGNFDQDNASVTTDNDSNVFIGSSWIADGPGRQPWDFRDGTLRGNRTHQLKFYGFYELNWNASVGAYFVYQSGQPWEKWSADPYRHLPGASSSDWQRFGEPAGSRTSSDHYQLDLNYTQNFYFGGDGRYAIQLRADMFNVFDKQTGYDIQPRPSRSGFGEPVSYWNPRRLQLTAKFIF